MQKHSAAVCYTVWDPGQKISVAVVLCNSWASHHVAHNNVLKKEAHTVSDSLIYSCWCSQTGLGSVCWGQIEKHATVVRRMAEPSDDDTQQKNHKSYKGQWPLRSTAEWVQMTDSYRGAIFTSVELWGAVCLQQERHNCGLVGGKSKQRAHWLVWSGNLAGMRLQSVGFPLYVRLKKSAQELFFWVCFFYGGLGVWRWRFDETLVVVVLNSFELLSQILLREKSCFST